MDTLKRALCDDENANLAPAHAKIAARVAGLAVKSIIA